MGVELLKRDTVRRSNDVVLLLPGMSLIALLAFLRSLQEQGRGASPEAEAVREEADKRPLY